MIYNFKQEVFFDLFRSYGATEEMIEVVKTKLPVMPEEYYESNIEHKLALLDAVGVPIDKICGLIWRSVYNIDEILGIS